MLCHRPTGPFRDELQAYGPTRHHWTGPDGEPKVACGYDAPTSDAMICHLLVTHEYALDRARRTVASWIGGG